MKLRVARHTNNLNRIAEFYQSFLGMNHLGSFNDHDGYHGIFLGFKNQTWQLEFTSSEEAPNHHSDADDLLVFYAATVEEMYGIINKLRDANVPEVMAKNPYWQDNGSTFLDPDGFRFVISL